MVKSNYEFYLDRLAACPSYGFRSGHEILNVVLQCAANDLSLTGEEFNSIMNYADMAHIKMMEDEYNAGWEDQ